MPGFIELSMPNSLRDLTCITIVSVFIIIIIRMRHEEAMDAWFKRDEIGVPETAAWMVREGREVWG